MHGFVYFELLAKLRQHKFMGLELFGMKAIAFSSSSFAISLDVEAVDVQFLSKLS